MAYNLERAASQPVPTALRDELAQREMTELPRKLEKQGSIIDRLHAEDLANNTAAPPAGPTLHERTEPAAMGEITAFLSHSWSDENDAPGAKHAAVSRWATRHREKTGSEPTLWLVGLARLQPFLSTRHRTGSPHMPA